MGDTYWPVAALMQQQRSLRLMLAAAGALRCSGLRLGASALGNSAARLHSSAARCGVALHATTSGARQARRAAQYDGETVAGLKALLKERGLPVSGAKAALVERLANSDQSGGALSASPPRRADAALAVEEAPAEAQAPTGRPFATLGLSPQLAANVEEQLGAGALMTPIQEMAFPAAHRGDDVVARAQTGTGKTLAFLVPSLDALEANERSGRPSLVVLSPTRELAQQIEVQAKSLCEGLGLRTCCVVGGTSKSKDLQQLRKGVEVLVATPGRLCDLLTEDKKLLRGTKTLVLDEGDRLLDEGFERQVSQIIEASSRSRQTLCFSATMPADLKRMLDSGAVLPSYERIDATGSAGGADQTASRVDLRRVALPKGADALGALANILESHKAGREGSKVVVFFPTTAAAELASAYLDNRGIGNAALHSRKSQGYRTRVSNEFRDSNVNTKHAMLVATDVAARGVDYPGVSLVVQAGTPDNREQFVHRSGRTGRAGTSGEAVLLVEDWEFALASDMLRDVQGLQDLDAAPFLDVDSAASQKAMAATAPDVRRKAYVGWLGHTNGRCKNLGWSKQELVDRANTMALEDFLLRETPAVSPRAAGFMGLKKVQNLRVEKPPGGGGRGGGRGRSGGGRR